MVTPKAIFRLKEPNKEEATLIFLVARFKRQKLVYSIGERIKPKYWNPDSQKAITKKNDPLLKERKIKIETYTLHQNQILNDYLLKVESTFTTIFRNFIFNNIEITPQSLKKALIQKLRGDNVKSNNDSLINFIRSHIDNVKFTQGGTPIAPNTKKKYETTLKHLENFQVIYNRPLSFQNIDLKFYSDFLDYLIYRKKFTDNTAGKYIATLKAFLNEATSQGINNNLDFRNKRFATPYEEVNKIYLTESELLSMYNMDLSKNPKLDRVRDLFLVGAYTGLRFSDFTGIKQENIYSNEYGKFLKIKTMKTGTMVVIPLHWMVKDILSKYSGKLPGKISNQKMNEYIKNVAELAKINEGVLHVRNKAGKRKEESKEKWELVTTHTARRSFATNAFLSGDIPTLSIRKITGHKTEQAFLRYIQMNEEDNANKLIQSKFFTSKPK
jgi:integrase